MTCKMKTTILPTLLIAFAAAFAAPGFAQETEQRTKTVEERAATVIEKLHAEVVLSTDRQAQATHLTVVYFQERQAVLDAADKESSSKEVMMQLKEIEDRYQTGIDQLLTVEQRETRAAKQEERKNSALQEAQAAAAARNQQQNNQ